MNDFKHEQENEHEQEQEKISEREIAAALKDAAQKARYELSQIVAAWAGDSNIAISHTSTKMIDNYRSLNLLRLRCKEMDIPAQNFYVDNIIGYDSTNNGSPEAPFATIAKAVDSIPVGGEGSIYLRPEQDHKIGKIIKVVNKSIGFYVWGGGPRQLSQTGPLSFPIQLLATP